MNILNISQSVENSIRVAGGNDEDIRIWQRTWEDLSSCCVVVPGISDSYTKDVVLCWSGWVLAASSSTADLIYAATKGFNLSFREDDAGQAGSDKMFAGIDKHVMDPASVYRELAKDQIERIQGVPFDDQEVLDCD